MDIQKVWEKALRKTEIIRGRVQSLLTFKDTIVPYILLSESQINIGDTVVRKGEVIVEKPSIILPPNIPQLEGFEFEQTDGFDKDSVVNFLLIRGIQLPSLRYNNKTQFLDVYEDSLSKAIVHYNRQLQETENVTTGLLTCPEDCWQLSVLIFICTQILKNTDIDIKNLINDLKRKQ